MAYLTSDCRVTREVGTVGGDLWKWVDYLLPALLSPGALRDLIHARSGLGNFSREWYRAVFTCGADNLQRNLSNIKKMMKHNL